MRRNTIIGAVLLIVYLVGLAQYIYAMIVWDRPIEAIDFFPIIFCAVVYRWVYLLSKS